jgi:hypothetical protein
MSISAHGGLLPQKPAPKASPYVDPRSLPSLMRRRRFAVVNALIADVLRKQDACTILDIGGTEYYWRLNEDFLREHRGRIRIVTVNLWPAGGAQTDASLFEHVTGDATLEETYKTRAFDLVHSNSVIEHVGGWQKIRDMANHIRNAARPYYLQTPNFWFPMEPHFRTIGFQWLPAHWRARLLLRRQRGFRSASSWDGAMASVESVNLLTGRQMRELFPDAELQYERIGPFIKSFMVVKR